MQAVSGQLSDENQTIGTALALRMCETPYFLEVLDELELAVRHSFIYRRVSPPLVSDETFRAGLRFADLLSHSQSSEHRSLSYKILAVLHDLNSAGQVPGKHKDALVGVTESVLIELGNFPAVRTLRRRSDLELAASPSKEATRALKYHRNQTKRVGQVYTDDQVAVVAGLEKSNFFSFSGPTSLGKSFILKDQIFGLVSRPEMNDQAIVVVVPTRALISQTMRDLREILADQESVHVSQHPHLPPYIRRRYSRTVFVFTPERLLNYVSKPSRSVAYLFVDEAQKVIAESDSRSPLYYHAINESLRTFATKLVFASPNISNPSIFLQLFQKSPEGQVSVQGRTVTQQKYFVDLYEGRVDYYRDLAGKGVVHMDPPPEWVSKFDVVEGLTGDEQSIVYINSARGVVLDAMSFAEGLDEVRDPSLDDLMNFAGEHVHEKYFLISCLRKGVAFHHGRMPQDLRERIEQLYASDGSPLKYVFCTSTLLEGVNLPAKNIFVLSDRHGLRGLTQMDFENLIGRAGRLTHDFLGNVVCIRDTENAWKGKTRSLIASSDPLVAESFLVNPAPRRKKEFTDIEKILTRKPLPRGRSAEDVRNAGQYASILTFHEMDGHTSGLKTLFLDRIDTGRDKLRAAVGELTVPSHIIRRTPDIAAHYQERAWRSVADESKFLPLLAEDADLTESTTYMSVLRRLHSQYDWAVVESVGNYKLVPSMKDSNSNHEPTQARLRYWANLMRSWVEGKPLHQIIRSSILYYKDVGQITIRDFDTPTTYRTVPFVESDLTLLNQIIEDVLLDIEVGLRFRIMRYIQNFYDISVAAQGQEKAGVDLARYLEYGTQDTVAVALQDAGLSRSTSVTIALRFGDTIQLTDAGELLDIDLDSVLSGLVDDDELVREVSTAFGAADLPNPNVDT